LFDKIYGCLLGGAIGDAMDGVTEMMHYRHIEAVFGVSRTSSLAAPQPPPRVSNRRRPQDRSPMIPASAICYVRPSSGPVDE
jgi:ADP-ribosylglycohydrolase